MSDKVNNVWQDEEGYIWVVDEVGFSRINGEEVVNFRPEMGKVVNESFTYRKDGKFYFEGGYFDGEKYKNIKTKKSIGNFFWDFKKSVIQGKDTFSVSFMSITAIKNPGLILKFNSDQSQLQYIISSKGDTIRSNLLKNYSENIIFNYDSLIYHTDFFDTIKIDIDDYHTFENLLIESFSILLYRNSSDVFIPINYKNSKFIEITSEGNIGEINFPGIKYIHQLQKDDLGNYYALSYQYDIVLYLSPTGEILNKINLNYDYRFEQLIKSNGKVSFISGNKKYALDDGEISKITKAPYNIEKVFDINNNESFLSLYTGNEEVIFYEKANQFFRICSIQNFGEIKKAFKDLENNIWILFDDRLLKLVFKNNFLLQDFKTDEIFMNKSVSYTNTKSIYNDNKTFTFHFIHQKDDKNLTKLIIYKNDYAIDTIHYNEPFKLFSAINDSCYFLSQNLNENQYKIGYINLKSPNDIVYTDTVYHYITEFKDNYISFNDYDMYYSYSLDGIDSKTKLPFKKYSHQYIGNNEHLVIDNKVGLNQFYLKIDEKLSYLFGIRCKQYNIEPYFIRDKFVFHFTDLNISIIDKDNDTILHHDEYDTSEFVILDKKGELINSLKYSDFEVLQYTNVLIEGLNSILFVTKGGKLALFNLDRLKFEQLKLDNFDNILINEISYDSISKQVFLLAQDKIYSFYVNDIDLDSYIVSKVRFLFKNSTLTKSISSKLDYAGLEVKNVGNNHFVFFVGGNVYEYNSNFSPPFKKLKFNLNQLNLSNTSKTEITKISDFNSKGSFNHTQNNFTFHYKTISHYFPETIQYRYKLEGSDYEEWITTKIDSVNFSNLPPGKYTFVVQAFNGYEVYSDEIRYEFTIHPPFWQTWWFRIGAVLLLFLILYFIYKARTKQLLKRQKQLEKTVDERTKEVVEQKSEAEKQRDFAQKEHQEAERQRHLVEEKNTEILDSINYAKRLQDAILPPVKLVKEYFEESFILFRPKDIVSGDFYWMETKDNLIMFAAADCTGHGVPGAMVSVVCANALNKSVNELHLTDPAAILNATREIVIETFTKTGSDVKDGMDISLCVLNEGTETLHWAGANNPLWIVRRDQNEIEAVKPDKQPIGMYGELKPFTSHSIKVNGGDSIYMFSDGYADQFGGERGKKLKSGKFKELLLTNRHEKMEAQKKALNEAFESWKGDLEQIDDVCVIGVRLEEKKDNPFTRREMEIIQHLEQGNSSKMIAEKLFISKTTVDTHRRRILKKAEVGNVTELIKFCKDGGLI